MRVRVINGSKLHHPDLGVWEFPHCPADRDLIVGEDGLVYQVHGPATWFPLAHGGTMAIVYTRPTGAQI